MAEESFDAIVIGSGMTGGWAAKELTEKGLKTLVLEAGRSIEPKKDYVEHVPAADLRFRGQGDRRRVEIEQPIQSGNYACDEWASKFFVNDKENPYTTAPGSTAFPWIRGRQVGGRSITWGRQTYRWSDLDFEANVRDGTAVDWPIRYADIAPWYDYVEDYVGISGQTEGLAHLPDGRFLPPMKMNAAELLIKERLAKRFGRERLLTIGRCAVLTQAHRGRSACHYCGPCHRGCITRSYFNSIGVTLPAAEATGRLTLRPYSIVTSLTFDRETRRISGVQVIDANTRQTTEFRAHVVFLCASTIESTRLLLLSATSDFPNGLANGSGQLGHNLMDHYGGIGARGSIEAELTEPPSADVDRPNFSYLPRFRNLKPSKHSDFLRGYAFQVLAWRDSWRRGTTQVGFGADFKRALAQPGPWGILVLGFGECLPNYDNYVELDKDKVDAWGVPVPRIHFTWGDNERKMGRDMISTATELLGVAGCDGVAGMDSASGQIHEMGTARMGRDPKTSVLNGYNQAHEIKNLFVTDGAAMTSSSCVNPSLTYMALTARACDFAVREMKKGNL